jgi:redox-sensitive bicupin YhaK (pirin superfamily)
MGNGSVLRYGDVQRMSAGTGVRHGEFNHSKSELVHFLQIWITPNVTGIEPSYAEMHVDRASKQGRLRLIASPDGTEGSLKIHQDASIYASILNGDDQVRHELAPDRTAYVHVARGRAAVNGTPLATGDAVKITAEQSVTVDHAEDAEILLFDLPY